MARSRLPRELFSYSLTLIVALCASAAAQSLGDLAREERQKKASAQGDPAKIKTFSNLDNPQPGVSGANGRTNRNRSLGGESLLQITAPADGTVVNPGQTVTVRVTSPSGAAFENVAVLGQDPLGISTTAKSVPAQFSITIPSNISACRKYSVTAVGVPPAGESVFSDSIALDVERPDTPVSISSFQFPSLTLEANDPPFHLIILATFSDGSQIEVTESSYVTYQSSNTAVATVDPYAGTKAVGPGTASIEVAYKNPNGGSMKLSVPVTVSSRHED
jgi:hypothetical protein